MNLGNKKVYGRGTPPKLEVKNKEVSMSLRKPPYIPLFPNPLVSLLL